LSLSYFENPPYLWTQTKAGSGFISITLRSLRHIASVVKAAAAVDIRHKTAATAAASKLWANKLGGRGTAALLTETPSGQSQIWEYRRRAMNAADRDE